MSGFYTFLQKDIYGYFLIFSRLSSILLTFPGFGSHNMSVRIRIMVGLVLSLSLYPILESQIPPYPAHSLTMGSLLLAEVVIGAFIGLCFHLLVHMLDLAGAIISFQASLSNIFVMSGEAEGQTTLPSHILLLGGVAILFTHDLHHRILEGIVASYHTIPVAHLHLMEDMATAMVQMANGSFSLAIRLTAPFLIGMTLLFSGMGILARLMPGIQIFFLAQPLQVGLGLILLNLIIAPLLNGFFNFFDQSLRSLFPHG